MVILYLGIVQLQLLHLHSALNSCFEATSFPHPFSYLLIYMCMYLLCFAPSNRSCTPSSPNSSIRCRTSLLLHVTILVIVSAAVVDIELTSAELIAASWSSMNCELKHVQPTVQPQSSGSCSIAEISLMLFFALYSFFQSLECHQYEKRFSAIFHHFWHGPFHLNTSI